MSTLRKKLHLVMAVASATVLLSCRDGGSISASPTVETVKADIEVPLVSSPSGNPHYSRGDVVRLEGVCRTGYRVVLSGAASANTICQNSVYSFDIEKTADGIYSFTILQYNPLNNVSLPASFTWYRKSSIAPLQLTSPTTTLFKSASDAVVLRGNCENLAVMSVSGDATLTGICLNSQFEFTVEKLVDDEYDFVLKQEDLAGNSASMQFAWSKHALVVTPPSAAPVVTREVPLTMTGGSGVYSIAIVENNSGASYNSVSGAYVAGTVAGRTDRLRVTDSLGATKDVLFSTAPDVPDHFELDPASAASAAISSADVRYRAKVVDRHGNAIPSYPVTFKSVVGNAQFKTDPRQTTDALGFAEVSLRLAADTLYQVLSVGPRIGLFPDLAGSGRSTLPLFKTLTASGTGSIGPGFPVGGGPGKFALSDFNEDGKLDVAVLNSSESSVGILRGKGNGLLEAMSRVQPVCSGLNGIVAGDFNEDGFSDLVVSCGSTDRFGFLRGKGDGTFYSTVFVSILPNLSFPVAVTAADFNGDGHLDVAVLGASTSTVGIWMGSGVGTFSAGSDFPVGASPVAMAALDMNRDNRSDLLVTSLASNTVTSYWNGGGGTFSERTVYPTGGAPVDVVSADFNSDNWIDAAVVNADDGSVTVYLNDQLGDLTASAPAPVGGSPTMAVPLDSNQDGKVDLAVVNAGDATVSLLTGQNNGAFLVRPPLPVGAAPMAIGVGEFNGDAFPELLVVSSSEQTIAVYPGASGGNIGFSTAVGNAPTVVRDGDFNGDGLKDLAVLSNLDSEVRLLVGNGKGLYSLHATQTALMNTVDVIVRDIDADGADDLTIVSKDLNKVRVYSGAGGLFSTPPVEVTTGTSPSAAAFADVNGDGILDLLVANEGGNTLSYLQGRNDGTFDARVDFNCGAGPKALRAADFNQDGHIDVALAASSAGTLSVLIGNGNGTFLNAVDYAAGNGTSDLVLDDFNGDTFTDAALLNPIDGTVAVMLNAQDGSFSGKSDYFAGSNPVTLSAGDFDGNGKIDLIASGGPGFGFVILKGGTLGQFNTSVSYVTTMTLEGLAVTDVNGDGMADAVFTSVTGNSVETWLGH